MEITACRRHGTILCFALYHLSAALAALWQNTLKVFSSCQLQKMRFYSVLLQIALLCAETAAAAPAAPAAPLHLLHLLLQHLQALHCAAAHLRVYEPTFPDHGLPLKAPILHQFAAWQAPAVLQDAVPCRMLASVSNSRPRAGISRPSCQGHLLRPLHAQHSV
jgi:hypothetical protein